MDQGMDTLSADEIIRLLRLAPHPEGGHYRETFRDTPSSEGRSYSTAIYYLLGEGEVSRWHRLTDASELWHFYSGASLQLRTRDRNGAVSEFRIGADLAAGAAPQFVVPRGVWQSARSLGKWTLVGCTVAPGFSFDGMELDASADA